MLDKRQGIEHVIAPEQGFILPGMVIAAGDSHTTTYGALGAFGFGIGTSEIEHLLASQTLVYKRLKTLRVTVEGGLSSGLTSKDVIMALIGKIGASGATGYAIEFTGSTIAALSVEARMTICNMAVEAGARGAFMAPDDKVFAYLKDKPRAPKGELWERAVARWKHLHSDPDAVFDREIHLDARDLEPMVTWGTSPDQASPSMARVPDPEAISRPDPAPGHAPRPELHGPGSRHAAERHRHQPRVYRLLHQRPDRRPARRRQGGAWQTRRRPCAGDDRPRFHRRARPGRSRRAGRDFIDAGFEWRQSGCSMCLAMNDDVLAPGDRCASSTNRNFEGRQGAGARTHLMSPAMVAAAAITGHLTDVRSLQGVS